MFYPLAIDGILGSLEGVRHDIVGSKLAAFGSLAAVIGGLLAAFVLLKIAHDYIEGQGITLWTILRPFVILMCICNFNSFVANPIHSLCNIFTNGMCRQTAITGRQYLSELGKVIANDIKKEQTINGAGYMPVPADWAGAITGEGPAEIKAEDSSVERFFKKTGHVCRAIFNATVSAVAQPVLRAEEFFKIGLVGILDAILVFVMKLVLFGQQVSCYLNLIMLSLLGPFAFAFAVLPSFTGNIRSWIANYISVSFWIPVGQMVMFINYQVLRMLASISASYDLAQEWVMIVVLLVSIFNISHVPQIASYVVSAAGGPDASGKAFAVVRETVQTVGAVAGLKK